MARIFQELIHALSPFICEIGYLTVECTMTIPEDLGGAKLRKIVL